MCQQSIINNHYLLNCHEGVFAQVTLGSARFSDCRNFGICRMNLIPATSTPDCKTCLEAYLRLDPPTGRLLLHFISASVNQPINQQFFSQQSFLMEEDFALPKAISSQLGFTGHPIIIERGSYPVLKDDLFLTLSLRVGHINKSSHYAVRNVTEH